MTLTGCQWVGKPLFCSPPPMLRGFGPLFPVMQATGGCPAGFIHLANNNMPPSGDDNPKECWPGTYAAFVSRSLLCQPCIGEVT